MNTEEVRRLIAQGEGPRLEFKRSLAALRDGVCTIAAFANACPEPVEGPMAVR
jgi:predicted HTH transcriptional regulator